MADGLLRSKEAAALCINQWYQNNTLADRLVNFRNYSRTCGSTTYTAQSVAYYGLIEPSSSYPVTAVFLGTDSCGIGYWHLSSFYFDVIEPLIVMTACTSGISYDTYSDTQHFICHVTDGGSTTCPYSGAKIVNHPGYFCVAAWLAYTDVHGVNQWAAFAAGDATAATVAAAKTACGITSEGCSPACPDIDVTILGLGPW